MRLCEMLATQLTISILGSLGTESTGGNIIIIVAVFTLSTASTSTVVLVHRYKYCD